VIIIGGAAVGSVVRRCAVDGRCAAAWVKVCRRGAATVCLGCPALAAAVVAGVVCAGGCAGGRAGAVVLAIGLARTAARATRWVVGAVVALAGPIVYTGGAVVAAGSTVIGAVTVGPIVAVVLWATFALSVCMYGCV
jgi:hypothetical protein